MSRGTDRDDLFEGQCVRAEDALRVLKKIDPADVHGEITVSPDVPRGAQVVGDLDTVKRHLTSLVEVRGCGHYILYFDIKLHADVAVAA